MTKTRRPILFSDTMILLLLILFVCITSSVATIDETTRISETRISTSNEKEGQQDDEDALLVQETIRVSRGSRDERGERDQWASTEHLNDKFDSRKPISRQVTALLKRYGLECQDCDHNQAVAKINVFVQQAREEEEKRRERQSIWTSRLINGSFAILLGVVVYFKAEIQVLLQGTIIQGGNRGAIESARRRNQMERQRKRAAEERAIAKAIPANWREEEEKKVWSSKQETQFARALKAFGGLPSKTRYALIAEKVEGKSRIECLLHHNLLKAREKEKSVGVKDQ